MTSASWTAIVSTAVAVGSLALNLHQYTDSSAQKMRERTPTGYFAYANDSGVTTLGNGRIPTGFEACKKVGVAQVGPAAAAIDQARDALRDPKWVSRPGPVVAFLVIQNDTEHAMSALLVKGIQDGQQQELARLSVLESKECTFIPLDFISPRSPKAGLDVPIDVAISFDGGELKVERGSPIRWLDSDFLRGFTPRAASSQ